MKKILIADDSLFIRKVLTDILNRAGYENIITASDGVETIEKCREEKPNLIFLDIIMDKKDGIEVLEEIRAFDQNVDVVVLTSVGQEDAASKAMIYGIIDYITKPFDEAKILSIVKRVLG
ncbi:MAG: response regulator [Candidatus Aenigmarchaeota archaeon]|nr:response regulator [Candidatus Aenigmarchaeota archaeon]